jgi:hypothetical protein
VTIDETEFAQFFTDELADAPTEEAVEDGRPPEATDSPRDDRTLAARSPNDLFRPVDCVHLELVNEFEPVESRIRSDHADKTTRRGPWNRLGIDPRLATRHCWSLVEARVA